ncbi:hypothetical protein [Arthrobacter sp. GCM10020060]
MSNLILMAPDIDDLIPSDLNKRHAGNQSVKADEDARRNHRNAA